MSGATLQHYIALTQFLGTILGPDYEVVLLDPTDPENAVVAIANGHISGRTVGAPMTDMARKCVDNREYDGVESRINYPGIAMEDGRMLRASTFFIKDHSGELTGMLCVNFDDKRYRELSDKLLKLRHPDAFVETNFAYNKEKARQESNPPEIGESFHASVLYTTEQVIAQVSQDSGVPVARMTRDEKQQIIDILEEKGVFLVKNAVKVVAEQMHCSPATVYRYLKK